jgi:HlyD family secretion protein
MQLSTFIGRIKAFFTKKKIIWTAVIVVVLLGGRLIFGGKSVAASIQTGAVLRQDIRKTVLTTGQVVSSIDLSLSFQGSGMVRSVRVKEGDQVYEGQTLATLDQSNAMASLESARGALAQAQANYDKIKAAATVQDIAVSQAAVTSASITLENAKQSLLNQLSTAYNAANIAVLSSTGNLFSNPQTSSPQFSIPGTVQTNTQATVDANSSRARMNEMLPAWQAEVAAATDVNMDQVVADSQKNIASVSAFLTTLVNITTLYTQTNSSAGQTALSAAQAAIPAAKTSVDAAATAITASLQAVRSAAAALAQAQAALGLKQSPARPEDISIAAAQVQSAQGQVDVATAALGNTVIAAPASGTITQVDVKLGEQAQAGKEAMKLLNVGQLHTEAAVSEADIASVSVGQTIDNTFDALGPDRHFASKVLTVNPASTVVSGVVNYKVTGSLENIPEVRPGMTSNMTILVAEKSGVLVVPSSAIVNRDGKKYARVIDDLKKKTYHEAEVQTGLEADGGLVEVTSGLTEGQQIVTYIKS